MNTNTAAGERTGIAVPREARDTRYLFGPVVDFFCLGGVSLLVLPLLLLVPAAQYELQFSAFMLLLANFINHPHFAHSYQMFYRGFSRKAFDRELARLHARYLFSGVGVPCWSSVSSPLQSRSNVKLLGQGGNIMALFVGWHYVKQGYGMLMVDGALKRRFFTATDKRIFLFNSYAVWIDSWISFKLRHEAAGLLRNSVQHFCCS